MNSYLVHLLSDTMFNIFSDTEALESFPITLQHWCSALMSVDHHLIAAQCVLYASLLTILHSFCSQHCNYDNSNYRRSGPRIHLVQPFFFLQSAEMWILTCINLPPQKKLSSVYCTLQRLICNSSYRLESLQSSQGLVETKTEQQERWKWIWQLRSGYKPAGYVVM